ncbi:3-oxoacyl-[acyl-carrier protein] reductase [Labilithrix luteola]|uniref:3-oxoacyl-[acyl-carrier protein] reductase n=1 Tax=Labilithrix luteola TaxID=1391654 RepID=A0A0K1Q4B2_9BACT|nr:SDR family oxidoreductase [Labilithrix luteola]AKV00579.1 3-oxoacyl-[acyl-carrier protein] reductase [Labilithrix luteola]
MDLNLQNKRALVTGSTVGIGYAIALRLAREGAEVVLHGRSQGRVDDAVKSITSEIPGARVRGVTADLATDAGARRLSAEVPDVDILVNNAGIYGAKDFEELTHEDWTRIMQVNVYSGATLAQQHLPRMLERNSGRIIFISSESASNIPVEMIHYGVSKAAQSALARGLAERTRGTAVTVNSVLAGPTKSEGVEEFVRGLAKQRNLTESDVEKEFFTLARPGSLIHRFATPDEVANVVAFVASPLASIMNGGAIRAEGGLLKNML